MANAIRSRTVQKGIDPRGFALVAFGGAGPLHGAEVAAMLDIPEVIVPPYPGITSAMGLLTTDLKYDVIRTEFQVSGVGRPRRASTPISRRWRRSSPAQFAADHVPTSDVSFQRVGDLRYVGQGYELKIPFPAGTVGEDGPDSRSGRPFMQRMPANTAMPSRRARSRSSICASAGIGHIPKLGGLTAPAGGSLAKARIRTGRMRLPRRRQARLAADRLLPAPAAAGRRNRLPARRSCCRKTVTTVIPPRASATVDASGNIVIRLGAG